MEIKSNVKLHNKFVIEVRDAKTNELKQTATSYNIILDAMYTRLCGGSTYFVNIHFGTGTGTLAASRTSLFTHLGTKVAVNEEQVKAIPTSSWTRKIVINPEEFVGSTFREVGIAFGATNTNLVTHSLLKDDQGSPLEITKTATDVITIYATVFVTLDTTDPNLRFIGLPSNNALINYLVGGAVFPTNTTLMLQSIESATPALAVTASLTWTSNTSLKRRISNTPRFGTTQGNGHITALEALAMFSLKLPHPSIYPGSNYTGVALGTGDGNNTTFRLPSLNVKQDTVVPRLNGNATAAFTKSRVFSGYNHVSTVESSLLSQLSFSGDIQVAFDPVSNVVHVYDLLQGVGVYRESIVVSRTIRSMATNFTGNRIVLTYDTVPEIEVYERIDEVWTPVLAPVIPFTTTNDVIEAKMSRDGLSIACRASVTPFMHVWDLANGVWVFRPTPASFTVQHSFSMSYDFKYIGYNSGTSNTTKVTRVWDAVSQTWTAYGNSFSQTGNVCSVSLNGEYLHCDVFNTWGSPVYRLVSNSWVAVQPDPPFPSGIYESSGFSDDNTMFVVYTRASPGSVLIYNLSGSTLTFIGSVPMAQSNDSEGNFVLISSDKKLITVPKGVVVMQDDFTDIVFDTPPAAGVSVTADYTVDGIHKTDQYVVDASFSIQFGEG